MSVFAIEVARVLSERSLEISFANALSSVASGVGEDTTVLDLEAALQVTLQTWLVRTMRVSVRHVPSATRGPALLPGPGQVVCLRALCSLGCRDSCCGLSKDQWHSF